MQVLVHGQHRGEIVTDTDGLLYLLSNNTDWNSSPHPSVGIGEWNCACRVSSRFASLACLIDDEILPLKQSFFTRDIRDAY